MVPVVVAGAGPTGLLLALALRRYGVAVQVVERLPGPASTSRALALWPRSLEILDRYGCTPALAAAAHRPPAFAIVDHGRPLAAIPFRPLPDCAFDGPFLLAQAETEAVLAAEAEAAGVPIERGVELRAFEADAGGVHLTLQQADGAERRLTAAWLVGCDGAHSTVRHGLPVTFEGEAEAVQWVIVDYRLGGDFPSPTAFWTDEGLMLAFPFGRGLVRLVLQVGEGEGRPDIPSPAAVAALVAARGAAALLAGEPLWISTFGIQERQVSQYRSGRVLLAGDAAHVHSPAGGQGMNTGLQDAFNLAWKLALVSRGLAGQGLLDSYDAERRPVGAAVIALSAGMLRMATLRNPLLRGLRRLLLPLLLDRPFVARRQQRRLSEVDIAYDDSPLDVKGSAKTRLRPGRRLPTAGEYLSADDPRPQLLLPPDGALAGVLDGLPPAVTPRPLAPGVWAALRQQAGQPADGAVLLRPDGHLAGVLAAADLPGLPERLRRLF